MTIPQIFVWSGIATIVIAALLLLILRKKKKYFKPPLNNQDIDFINKQTESIPHNLNFQEEEFIKEYLDEMKKMQG